MESNTNDNDKSYLPHIPTGEELMREQPNFLAEDKWQDVDIEDSMLDVTKEYELPRYGLLIGDTPCAPIGGLHGITGQAGHGKTMTIAMLMAAYLGDKSHGMCYGLDDARPHPTVLYVDTEMEPENTMMVNLRVCAMLGWSFHEIHEEFNIMCLRGETSAENRWKKILKAVYTFKPTVVFIDGLIDIVADFNDNQQCQEIIFKLMAMASHYDMSVWAVLHQNPNSNKMVGHAGSFLERKSTDIFETKKEKDKDTGKVTFTIQQKKARGKDIDDFTFTVSDSKFKFGIPEITIEPTASAITKSADDMRREKLTRLFGTAVNWKAKGNTWTAIKEDIAKTRPLTNHSYADLLNDAQEMGIIEKVDKKYFFKANSIEKAAEQGKLTDINDNSGDEYPF